MKKYDVIIVGCGPAGVAATKVLQQNQIDFCPVKGEYGWIFPKANGTTVGLGVINGKKQDYVNLLCNFAKKHHCAIHSNGICGYHIPLFLKKIYRKSIIDDKIILVGDAASLVDAVSGEGIYYALYSGMKAVEGIVSCLREQKDLKKTYFEATKEMSHALTKRNFWSKLLYSPCGIFLIKLGLSNSYFIKRLNRSFG